MITKLSVNNFRNLKNITIQPKLITLLIGSNGSGKSGIFHSLLVVKQTLDSASPRELIFSGKIVNLGSRKETVFQHEENHPIEIEFKSTFAAPKLNNTSETTIGEMSYKVISRNSSIEFEQKLKIDELEVLYNSLTNKPKAIINGNDINFAHYGRSGIFGFSAGFNDPHLRIYDMYISSDFVRDALGVYLLHVPVPRGFTEFKSNVPPRKFEYLTSEFGVEALTRMLLGAASYDIEFVDKISTAMEELFGKRIRMAPIEQGMGEIVYDSQQQGIKGTIDFYDKNGRHYAANTGFGMNQILFLFHKVIDSPKGSTIMIEEPEISLHPVAQRKLMEILIHIAKRHNKQLIITSHSEHVAFALFRALEKGQLNADELAVYAFNQEKDALNTIVSEIKDRQGSLKEFLGNDTSMILEYIDAFGKMSEYIETGVIKN